MTHRTPCPLGVRPFLSGSISRVDEVMIFSHPALVSGFIEFLSEFVNCPLAVEFATVKFTGSLKMWIKFVCCIHKSSSPNINSRYFQDPWYDVGRCDLILLCILLYHIKGYL